MIDGKLWSFTSKHHKTKRIMVCKTKSCEGDLSIKRGFFFFMKSVNYLNSFPTTSLFCLPLAFFLYIPVNKNPFFCRHFEGFALFLFICLLSGGRAVSTCRFALSMTAAATKTAMLRTAGQRPAWTPHSHLWFVTRFVTFPRGARVSDSGPPRTHTHKHLICETGLLIAP